MRVGLCFDGFYSIQEMIELGQLADDIGMAHYFSHRSARAAGVGDAELCAGHRKF